MNYVYAFLMVYVTSKFCNREKFVIKHKVNSLFV